MNKIKNVCVFCGSHIGENTRFKEEIERFGELLVENNLQLIYGGANVGLMKVLAESVLSRDGRVIGIIPHFLAEKHMVQKGLTREILVDTMHERKKNMAEFANAFVTFPGGHGTLEELFEIITASQLSLHTKPIIIINIDGFYDHLAKHIDKMIEFGFVNEVHRRTIVFVETAQEAIDALYRYKAPNTPKYVDEVYAKYNK